MASYFDIRDRKPQKKYNDYKIWMNVKTDFIPFEYEPKQLLEEARDRFPERDDLNSKPDEQCSISDEMTKFLLPSVSNAMCTPQIREAISPDHLKVLEDIKMYTKKELFSMKIKNKEVAHGLMRKLYDQAYIFDGEIYDSKFGFSVLYGEKNSFYFKAKYWNGNWY